MVHLEQERLCERKEKELNIPPGAGISWISTAAATTASRRAGSSRASSIGRSTDEAPILFGGLGVCLRDGVLQISLAAVEADFETVIASATTAVAGLCAIISRDHLPINLHLKEVVSEKIKRLRPLIV